MKMSLERERSEWSKREARILAKLHLIILAALLILIISTPLLVAKGFSVFDEELIESTMILLLIGLSLTVFALYRREIRRKEESLTQFTFHLGTLNLQFDQMKRLYEDIGEWSKSQRSLRYLISLLADRVLTVVNAAWVVLRIIEPETGRTLAESGRTRAKRDLPIPRISNRRLLEADATADGCCVIGRDCLNLKAFCVLPVKEISQSQTLLIRVILDNLTMLQAAMSSPHLQERVRSQTAH